MRLNASEAVYLYEDPSSSDRLDQATADHIRRLSVPKRCDIRSARLWRNFLPLVYGMGEAVNATECAARVVDTGVAVRRRKLYQGIIDTISGPSVDVHQRVLSDTSAYVVGNAGSPSLLQAYVGPGSTLGHAFVSGFTAGRHAALATFDKTFGEIA